MLTIQFRQLSLQLVSLTGTDNARQSFLLAIQQSDAIKHGQIRATTDLYVVSSEGA